MVTSRTLGPLHFEDLEPKRFEDLVRQLAYDFKVWRRLEATGRAGSDDGFDARGYEIVAVEEPTEDEIGTKSLPMWQIACALVKASCLNSAVFNTCLEETIDCCGECANRLAYLQKDRVLLRFARSLLNNILQRLN